MPRGRTKSKKKNLQQHWQLWIAVGVVLIAGLGFTLYQQNIASTLLRTTAQFPQCLTPPPLQLLTNPYTINASAKISLPRSIGLPEAKKKAAELFKIKQYDSAICQNLPAASQNKVKLFHCASGCGVSPQNYPYYQVVPGSVQCSSVTSYETSGFWLINGYNCVGSCTWKLQCENPSGSPPTPTPKITPTPTPKPTVKPTPTPTPTPKPTPKVTPTPTSTVSGAMNTPTDLRNNTLKSQY